MKSKTEIARALAALARGVPKNYSNAERARRRSRIAKAREKIGRKKDK